MLDESSQKRVIELIQTGKSRYIDLTSEHLEDDDAIWLAKAIQESGHRMIEKIDFSSNEFLHAAAMQPLLDAIIEHPTITRAIFEGCGKTETRQESIPARYVSYGKYEDDQYIPAHKESVTKCFELPDAELSPFFTALKQKFLLLESNQLLQKIINEQKDDQPSQLTDIEKIVAYHNRLMTEEPYCEELRQRHHELLEQCIEQLLDPLFKGFEVGEIDPASQTWTVATAAMELAPKEKIRELNYRFQSVKSEMLQVTMSLGSLLLLDQESFQKLSEITIQGRFNHDAQWKTLFKKLENNNSIQKLDLSQQHLGEDAFQTLIASLENNLSIQEVKISDKTLPSSRAGKELLPPLLAIVQRNKSYQHIITEDSPSSFSSSDFYSAYQYLAIVEKKQLPELASLKKLRIDEQLLRWAKQASWEQIATPKDLFAFIHRKLFQIKKEIEPSQQKKVDESMLNIWKMYIINGLSIARSNLSTLSPNWVTNDLELVKLTEAIRMHHSLDKIQQTLESFANNHPKGFFPHSLDETVEYCGAVAKSLSKIVTSYSNTIPAYSISTTPEKEMEASIQQEKEAAQDKTSLAASIDDAPPPYASLDQSKTPAFRIKPLPPPVTQPEKPAKSEITSPEIKPNPKITPAQQPQKPTSDFFKSAKTTSPEQTQQPKPEKKKKAREMQLS